MTARSDGPVVEITYLSDIEPERVSWLWEARIPLGKITILDGDPGVGKTTLALDVAARLSRGRAMPDGTPGTLASTIVLTAEDGLADTIVPRLNAMDADVARIMTIALPTDDGSDRQITVPDDLEPLRAVIREENVRLVIIDPLVAFLSNAVNAHRDHDVRRALGPVARVAEDTGTAILCIRHLNKTAGASAIYRGGGSIGIGGAARSVLLAAHDPDDASRSGRVFAPVKTNLTESPESLKYHLEGAGNGASRVVWDGASVHDSDALVSQASDPEERSALEEARAFLEDALSDGLKPARDILKDGRANGHQEKTLRRAKALLGVKVIREGFGPGGRYFWSLPSIGAHSNRLTTYGEREAVSDDDVSACHRWPTIDGQAPLTIYGASPVDTYVAAEREAIEAE